jgi:hypothetical protein
MRRTVRRKRLSRLVVQSIRPSADKRGIYSQPSLQDQRIPALPSP